MFVARERDPRFSSPEAVLLSEVPVSKVKSSTVMEEGEKAECHSAGEASRLLQCLSVSNERLLVNNAAPSTLGFCRLSH